MDVVARVLFRFNLALPSLAISSLDNRARNYEGRRGETMILSLCAGADNLGVEGWGVIIRAGALGTKSSRTRHGVARFCQLLLAGDVSCMPERLAM